MQAILPEGWPRPKGYSNGVRVPAGHELVVVAGMIGWDASERLVSDDFVPQLEQALRNVLAVIEAAGGCASDLVRLTIYVTRLDDYRTAIKEVGEAWRRVLGGVYPAMALLEVSGLLEPGARVEVEALAAVPART
jgi:enamine deaminase RidA (YjgF/YER057c/UK114 family)